MSISDEWCGLHQGKELSVSPEQNCYFFCGFYACFQACSGGFIYGATGRAVITRYSDEWSMEKNNQGVKVHAERESTGFDKF